jgi:hypothetical protein
MDDRPAHRFEAGAHHLDRLGRAAYHDRQRPLAGTDVAAGNRGVESVYVVRRCPRRDLNGQRRLACAHVHQDSAGPRRTERAVRTEDHLTDIMWVSDHRKDDVRHRRHRGRRVDPGRAGVHQALGLFPVTARHSERVAVTDQMPAHRRAHHACADPAQGRHPGGSSRVYAWRPRK